MNKKYLILLTTEFPYKNGETFLEPEIDYLSVKFDKIIILSVYGNKNNNIVRKTSDNVLAFPLGQNHNYIKYTMRGVLSYNSNFSYKKVHGIKKALSLYFLGKNKTITKKAFKILHSYISSNVDYYVYSYWLTLGIAAINIANFIQKITNTRVRFICRCHRYDVYSELNKANYIPFQEEVIKYMDCVYCCSNHGAKYLQNKYPALSNKISVAKLFSNDHGVQCLDKKNGIKTFVTVSGFKPVKRLILFASAFAQVARQRNDIRWVAFGDGDELSKVKKIIANNNVSDKVDFYGVVPNSEIYNFYKTNQVYFFCNVSSSEGIPVSIMEASSFGIPILATNVGGTSEIVGNDNGFLIDKDLTVNALAEYLNECLDLEENIYLKMREISRIKWEEMYNASNNLEKWYEALIGDGK